MHVSRYTYSIGVGLVVLAAALLRAQQNVTRVEIKSGSTTATRDIQHGLPPFNFNGETPVLKTLSGDKQPRASGFLPQPIVIAVYRADGQTPWPGAPVTLGVEYGAGRWATSTAAAPAATLTVNADANGRVQAYYWLP